ncbi:LysE family transporter, partial [Mycobacterium tuberculosis]|nr:LysE family transporter [Mycobacterium tuberculosis]
VAALTGISALLTAYPSALLVLKIVGGAYLCFLGVLAARQALRIRSELRGAPLGPVGEIAAASDDIVSDGSLVEAPVTAGHPWGQLRSVISY